jgi:cystathionine beta-lyase/cystathionine gamma-synthase
MRGFGMLSFDLGSFGRRATCSTSCACALAESLEELETLICHPASMTHASVPPERRQVSASPAASCVRWESGIRRTCRTTCGSAGWLAVMESGTRR